MQAIGGILLPAYAYYVYWMYGDRLCAKPVSGWLSTYAVVSFITGGIGMWASRARLRVAPIIQHANTLEGDAKADAMAPAVATIASVSCLQCCIVSSRPNPRTTYAPCAR